MKTIRRVLTIANPKNTFMGTIGPQGSGWFRKDGKCFKRQAKLCGKHYADKHNAIVTPLLIPTKLKSRFDKRQWVLGELKKLKAKGIAFDRILFFCHGGRYNLDRKMFPMVSIDALAEHLAPISRADTFITLFSCWTGKKEDGFAAMLSSAANRYAIAHTERGHTTKTPYVILRAPAGGLLKQWTKHIGGARALKKQLWAADDAPFRLVEKIISDRHWRSI